MSRSLAEIAALQPDSMVKEWLAKIPAAELKAIKYRWDFWARPKQLPPGGDWSTWFVCAGRAFGKTRIGSEWVRSIMCGSTPLAPGTYRRIAIIAETEKDMIETVAKGPSGILAVHPPDFRPTFVSKGVNAGFTWPNGAVALIYNGTRPDQLRGPGPDAAWCDELAKWQFAKETWDNLQFSMRGGNDPRVLVTTTPRPLQIIKDLIDDPATVTVRGSLYENRANLPSKYINRVLERYAGTRLGRQEIEGEIIDDVPGALWTRAMLDATRKKSSDIIPPMQRLVVAIDPAAKASEDDDETSETGIIVAGIGTDGAGYVIDDRSCRLGPVGWAKVAIAAYDRYEADSIIAEINNGGEMVEALIRAQRSTVKVETVHATRGKVVRAEPVAALYEQGRISHIGSFPALEDQLITFTPFGIEGDRGSDRADALVWALTKLFPTLTSRERRKSKKESIFVSERDRSKVTGY